MLLTPEATLATVTNALDADSFPRLLLNTLAGRSVLISTGDHAPFLLLAAAVVFVDVDGTHVAVSGEIKLQRMQRMQKQMLQIKGH
jgi:hypothetical protein